MDWGLKTDVLPSLGSGAGQSTSSRFPRSSGLAPINPSNVRHSDLPKAPDDQDMPRQPKSSHGSRDVHRQAAVDVVHPLPRANAAHAHASTSSNWGQQLRIGQFPTSGVGGDQPVRQMPQPMPKDENQMPHSARQIRSSGGPRDPVPPVRGSLTAREASSIRPSSKGQASWAMKPNGIGANGIGDSSSSQGGRDAQGARDAAREAERERQAAEKPKQPRRKDKQPKKKDWPPSCR